MRSMNKWKLMMIIGFIVSFGAICHWNGTVSLDILIVGLAMIGTGYSEGKQDEQRGKM